MNTTTVTNFRKNIYGMLEKTVRFKQIVAEDGNAVVLSEEDYDSLMETLYLTSIPGMREKLNDGLHTPLDETVSEDLVEW